MALSLDEINNFIRDFMIPAAEERNLKHVKDWCNWYYPESANPGDRSGDSACKDGGIYG